MEMLAGKSRMTSESMKPFTDQFRTAKTDEARQAIQVQIREAATKLSRAAEAELPKVLSPTQVIRLRQLMLHRNGIRAITREDVAASLKLTDTQKQQFAKVIEERNQAGRSLGFRATQEDQEKFSKEWDGKMLAVLNADQQKTWVVSLGPPPVELAEQADPAEKPAPKSVTEKPSKTDPAKTDPTETKPDDDKPVVASFGGDMPKEGKLPKHLQFNFRQARWDVVLKMFAKAAGLSLDLNAKPSGTFSYYDNAKYTPIEA
ncbi:MAG: hypothetical protein ABGZ35_27745, partial [Planctomycetaceae bacterium]